MPDAQYPIGAFSFQALEFSPELRRQRIDAIIGFPRRFREALAGLDESMLDRSYRAGGWTVRQIAHHVPDSHMNGYIRFKWALTETTPTIKPYDQDAWASLSDSSFPIANSLNLLDAIHHRWSTLLSAMRDEDFARSYLHPEHSGQITLDASLANYAWHGDHHLAHVMRACQSAP